MSTTKFADLMAMSRTRDEDLALQVQRQMQERKRKLEAERLKKEEQERKEKEFERKQREQYFENQKREAERERQRLEKEAALEAEQQRREQIQRDNLLYGPKKAAAKGYPSANPHVRDQVRKSRLPADVGDDEMNGNQVLTREELRARKEAAAQRRMFGLSATKKSSSNHSRYSKHGKRLPGGAVDKTTTTVGLANSGADGQHLSARERIAAMQPQLIKLNVVKRDLRTIDEIQNDLKNAKALEGDDARNFNDFFTDRKKDSATTKHNNKTAPGSRTASPARGVITSSLSPSVAKSISKSSTPVPGTSSKSSTPVPHSIPKSTTPRPTASMKATSTVNSRASSVSSSRTSDAKIIKPQLQRTSNGLYKVMEPSVSSLKKRQRSESFSSRSVSPEPSRKKRRSSPDISNGFQQGMIYQLMRAGRRDHDDLFSDEEEDDMEAGAIDLEREEMRSARLAKKEDALALAAEKRHEAEKLRRKQERLGLARGGSGH